MNLIKDIDEEFQLYPLLKKLSEEGWQFAREDWVDGHKGTDEVTYHFKSPRMKDFATCYPGHSQLVTDLQRREIYSLSWHAFQNNKDSIEKVSYAAFQKHFSKKFSKSKTIKISITLKV